MSKRPPKPEIPKVVLTPEQHNLVFVRTEYESRIEELQRDFRNQMKDLKLKLKVCPPHVWSLKNPDWEWWSDEWHISAHVHCALCGTYGGWYCPKHPSGEIEQCEYADTDLMCDFCIHCGDPEERK